MNYTLAPLVIFIFSLLFVLLGAWVLLRQQWLMQWLKGTAGLLMVGLAIYLSPVSYTHLTLPTKRIV